MAVVRATKLLAQALHVRLAAEALPPSTKLGEWYGHVMPTSLGPLAVVINAPTRLALVSQRLDHLRLASELPRRLDRLLRKLGVPDDTVRSEVEGFGPVAYAKTADRRFIGSLNQVCQIIAARDEGEPLRAKDLDELEDWLAGMVHCQMAETFPDRAVRALLGGAEPTRQ